MKSIKSYLKAEKIKQNVFARQLGISEAALSLIVHQKRRPSPRLAMQIEKITSGQIKATDLVFGDDILQES